MHLHQLTFTRFGLKVLKHVFLFKSLILLNSLFLELQACASASLLFLIYSLFPTFCVHLIQLRLIISLYLLCSSQKVKIYSFRYSVANFTSATFYRNICKFINTIISKTYYFLHVHDLQGISNTSLLYLYHKYTCRNQVVHSLSQIRA